MMENRRKVTGPNDDVNITPKRRTRSSMPEQDGGSILNVHQKHTPKQKANTPKRCMKDCTEKISRGAHSFDSGKDVGTPSRFTRSRVRLDTDSPRNSSVKQNKRSASTRTGTHNDTPSRQTRTTSSLEDEELVESLRKKSRYILNMDADSLTDSPLKPASGSTDGDASGTPSRQTRGRSKINGKVNGFSPREGKMNSNVAVEVGKRNSNLNVKSIAGTQCKHTKCSSKCEEKSKCDSQRNGRVKTNQKEMMSSECPSRHTRSSSRSLEKSSAGSPQKHKGKGSDGKRKVCSTARSDSIVGRLGVEETLVTPTRQTKRCIIFSDSSESNVKQINKLTTSTTSSHTSTQSIALPNTSRPIADDEFGCESGTARRSKCFLSRSIGLNSDDESSLMTLANLTKHSLSKKIYSVVKNVPTCHTDIPSCTVSNKEDIGSTQSETLHSESVRLHTLRTNSRRSPHLSHKYIYGTSEYQRNSSSTQNTFSTRYSSDEESVIETTDISAQTDQAVMDTDSSKTSNIKPVKIRPSPVSVGVSKNIADGGTLMEDKDAYLYETESILDDTESFEVVRHDVCVSRLEDCKFNTKNNLPDMRTQFEIQTTDPCQYRTMAPTQEFNNTGVTERDNNIDIRTAELKVVSLNKFETSKSRNGNNLSSIHDSIITPKYHHSHEQLQVGSTINMKHQPLCEASTSSKLNFNVCFATPSLCSNDVQDASEAIHKESKDSRITCSVETDTSDTCIWYADDKGRIIVDGRRSITPLPSTSSSEILLCPQDSLSSVWTRELLDELVDISSSGSDGSIISSDMGYNLEDFVLRRRRLRSESQDSELWEGLPTSVRYRKSASKSRHLKSKDAINDADFVDDMMLCQDSSCMLINSDTDSILSDTAARYHERFTDTEICCGSKEKSTSLANIRHSSGTYIKDGDAKIDTWLTAGSESKKPSRHSMDTCDDQIDLNRASCSHWTSSSTMVPDRMKEISGTFNSYTMCHTSTSHNSRNDFKVLLDMSSTVQAETKSTTYTLQTPVTVDVLQPNISSTMSSNFEVADSCCTNRNPCSLQEENASQETDVSCTMSRDEKETEAQDPDIEITTSQVKSVRISLNDGTSDDITRTNDKPLSPMNNTAISQSIDFDSSSTNDNASSQTNVSSDHLLQKESIKQADILCKIVNDSTPTSKKEIFLAPLNKCCGGTFQTRRSAIDCKDHAFTDRAEPKSLSVNTVQTRTLKNTPRPTTSSSTPWMYNKQRLNSDCLASPFLVCKSSKSTATNASCSSSHMNDSSVNQSDQNTATLISLNMATGCSSGERRTEQTEDGATTHVSFEINAGIRDINNDKGPRDGVKRTDYVVISEASTENKTSSGVSNETIMNDTKLNYHKSKFPKVVLTPLKRSQRLIKKYGIDCPVKDVKTKQKRKKHEAITSSDGTKGDFPESSKNPKDVSSDAVLPSAENVTSDNSRGSNGPERKLAVRKHRRKQDLLEYQLTDDDTNEARPLPKVRKKAHVCGNNSETIHRRQTDTEAQQIKTTEKRKNKKGKTKPKASSTVSTSSNMFGLRRKRGPVVDEELLANPVYNKHACVLWSSEHRRHYHLIHPDADFNQLDNILRKHWEELLPTEKMRYFNRARDAVLDEFKHSKKSNTVLKQKSRSKECNQNITPMEKFCQLNAKRQKELLSKWLYFYQKVLSCKDYKWFIADVQRTLKNIQSSQKGDHKPLTSSKLEHRKLLFEKINKVKPKVISQYMDRCKKNTKTNDQSQRSVIQNLIKGLPQNFPKGYRSRCLTRVLEDLRELESKSLLHVVGIPRPTPSYTRLYKGITETNGARVQIASTSRACYHDGSHKVKDRTHNVREPMLVDATKDVSVVEKPLLDISNNEYVNKLISDLHTVKELPILEASEIESAFVDMQTLKLDQSRSTLAQSKSIGCSLVTALHKEAVDALARSQSGNGETCCELDSPSCILSTWLVADRVAIGVEPALKK